MKTTLDIRDELLLRAKRHARATCRPLRAVVEERLRQVIAASVRLGQLLVSCLVPEGPAGQTEINPRG